jgi:ADP-ribose pyrophosphatase YjhB (NUDIX family)
MSKIIIASGPVIVENGKALLDIQGDDDFWKFCGGKIREGESLKKTAIRRAKEELGIDIEIIDESPFLMHVSKERDGENTDVLLVHWLAKRIGEPKAGEGVRETEWVDIKNLPKDVGPNVKPALKHFGFTE